MKSDGIAEALMKKDRPKKEASSKEDKEPAEEKSEMGQTLLDAIREKDAQAVADAVIALIHETV